MADILRLSNISRTSNVDLLTGTLQLQDRTWQPRTAAVKSEYTHSAYGAQPDFEYYDVVTDQLDLVGSDTSSNLRTGVQDIEEMLEEARRWHANPSTEESRWIEWYVDGEGAKRSLLYQGALQFPANVGMSAMLQDGKVLARLAHTRHPFWESVTSGTAFDTDISCMGGILSISNVEGTVPARINLSRFLVNSGISGTITELWAGIREENQGTASFVATWEAEAIADGGAGILFNSTTSVADADCSNGYKARITFSTTTMLKRIVMRLGDVVGSNYDHFVGRYTVLARVKTSADITVLLRLRAGYYNTTTSPDLAPAGEYVQISDADTWKLYALGTVDIPGARFHSGYGSTLTQYAIQIDAQKVTGADTTIAIDNIILIPNTHFFHTDNTYVAYVANRELRLITVENDEVLTLTHGASAEPFIDTGADVTDWYLPTGNSILVLAAQTATAHDEDDTGQVYLGYYPRWLSFR